MSGKHKGVQKWLLDQNKAGLYVPCAAHSLNLVGVHAASINSRFITFFGTIQRLYVQFSSSTKQWDVLKRHIKKFTLKKLSHTRWSVKYEAVKTIVLELSDIIAALKEIKSGQNFPGEAVSEASSLLQDVNRFDFYILLIIWNDILSSVNRVNLFLQKKNISLSQAVHHISDLVKEMQVIRNKAFEKAVADATSLADKMGVVPEFDQKRGRKRIKLPGEKEDQSASLSSEQKFQIGINEAMDSILNALHWRFEAKKNLDSDFGFLSGHGLSSLSSQEVTERARNLAENYANDIDADEFVQEVRNFKLQAAYLDENLSEADHMYKLNILHKKQLCDVYPNIEIALRIFLTIPVTVASCERSFSKMKIIKNYLRSTMSEKRLTNLAIISIEFEIAKGIDFDDVIRVCKQEST